MSYEAVDDVIGAWAERHNLTLNTEFGGQPRRFCYVSCGADRPMVEARRRPLIGGGGLRRAWTILMPFAAMLSGCIDMGIDCKKVAGSYCLEQWEDGQTYYLLDGRADERPGGAIDGVVRAIAWGPDLILVDRKPLFGGDPEGWMVIDVRKHTVRGPISNAEATAAVERNSLRATTAAEAWKRLR